MQDNLTPQPQSQGEESLLLLKEVLIVAFMFSLCSLAGQLIMMFVLQALGMDQLSTVIENIKAGTFLDWLNPLRIILSFNHGFTFIAPALLFTAVYWKGKYKSGLRLQAPKKISYMPMAILFVLAILPLSNIIHYWNLQIPAAYHQNSGNELQKALMQMNSPIDLFFNFILVGIMAGVGEELLFRGVLQRLFAVHLKKIHIAIWLTAILFSLIHFEMQAFFPRVVLGAMFGYIAYWTNSVLVAIILHSLYNSSQLLLVYNNPEVIAQTPSAPMTMQYIFAGLGLLAVLAIGKWFEKNRIRDNSYFESPRT